MSNIQKRKRSVKRPMSTVSLVTYYALSKNPFDSCDWYEWYALQAIGISLVNCMLFWPAQVAPKNAQWPRGGLQLINNWHWRPWKIDKADCTIPLARMVRLYPERQRNQSTYLLVLPCDFMRQLGATIVLLLNLTNFIIKQINFPALEKKKLSIPYQPRQKLHTQGHQLHARFHSLNLNYRWWNKANHMSIALERY